MYKAFLELFDLSYILENKKDLILFYLYMTVHLVYSINVLPPDIPLAISLIIFLIASTKGSFFMFVFYLLWEYVTTFTFGVPLVLLLQILLVLKLFVSGSFSPKQITPLQSRYRNLQYVLVFVLLIYGFFSFLLTSGFTGIGLVFKGLIAIFAVNYLSEDDKGELFFKAVFHILMISTVIATVYGFFNDTALERWISGLGDSFSQLYGTLGTTRMGIFYVLSCSFFLFYVENRIVKYLGLVAFVVLTILTISITAILLLLGAVGIYLLSIGRFAKIVRLSFMLVLVSVLTFPLWSKISFVEPIVYRFAYSIDAYKSGDMNSATTGREDLSDFYLDKIEDSSFSEKLFGFSVTAAYQTGGTDNSHNSFIDMLYYCGYVGVLLFILYEIKKIRMLKSKPYFFKYLSLKAIIIVGALSVSIMTSTYFCFLSFI